MALRLPLMLLPRSRAPRSTLRLRSRVAPVRAVALSRLRLVAPSRAPRLHARVAAPLRAAAEDEASAPAAARCVTFRAGATAAPRPQRTRLSLTPRLLRACSAEAPAEAPPTPSPAPPKASSGKDSLEARPGQPKPLGPSPLGDDAVNFALWSKNATAVTLCMCVRRRPSAPRRAAALGSRMSPSVLTCCAALRPQLPGRGRQDAVRGVPAAPHGRHVACRGGAPAALRRALRCAALASCCGAAALRGRSPPPPCCCAQASRSAATAAGKPATGGTQTWCFWTRAWPLAPSVANTLFGCCCSTDGSLSNATHHALLSCCAGMRRWWLGATSLRTRRSLRGRAPSPAPSTLILRRCVCQARAAGDGQLLRRAPLRAVRLARGQAAGAPGCVRSGHAQRIVACSPRAAAAAPAEQDLIIYEMGVRGTHDTCIASVALLTPMLACSLHGRPLQRTAGGTPRQLPRRG